MTDTTTTVSYTIDLADNTIPRSTRSGKHFADLVKAVKQIGYRDDCTATFDGDVWTVTMPAGQVPTDVYDFDWAARTWGVSAEVAR